MHNSSNFLRELIIQLTIVLAEDFLLVNKVQERNVIDLLNHLSRNLNNLTTKRCSWIKHKKELIVLNLLLATPSLMKNLRVMHQL